MIPDGHVLTPEQIQAFADSGAFTPDQIQAFADGSAASLPIDMDAIIFHWQQTEIARAMERPRRPPKKPKQLRLFRSPKHAIKVIKTAGRISEVTLRSDGTLSIKMSASNEVDQHAEPNSGQPGPSPSEADLDRELAEWQARHDH